MAMTSFSGGMSAIMLSLLVLTPAFTACGHAAPLTVEGGRQTVVSYDCGAPARKEVTYINAEANALAILDVEGKQRIFVNVISGSGARYASGRYIWWSKGREASLYDLMLGDNAPPVLQCRERR